MWYLGVENLMKKEIQSLINQSERTFNAILCLSIN